MRYSRATLPAAAIATSFLLCTPRPAAVQAEDRTAMRTGQATPAAPTIKVYSRETIVDVTVTDAKGYPVHGLTRDDFTVKEDGRAQPIRSFEEFGRKAVQAPPKLPANVHTNLQPPAPSGATNVLWLDFTNAAPVLARECCTVPVNAFMPPLPVPMEALGIHDMSVALARQARKQYAMDYLKRMPAGTRAAVFGTWYPPGQGMPAQGPPDGLVRAAGAPQSHDRRIPDAACRRSRLRIKGRKNLLWFTMRIQTLVESNTTYRVCPTSPGTCKGPTDCSPPHRSPCIPSACAASRRTASGTRRTISDLAGQGGECGVGLLHALVRAAGQRIRRPPPHY